MIRLFLIFVLVFIPVGSVMADAVFYKTRIIETSLLEAERGGCMVRPAIAPSKYGLACDYPWVHFSCNGAINSSGEGLAKLSAAQLALISGTEVKIKVDDDPGKKIKGYCYAPRIDNLAN